MGEPDHVRVVQAGRIQHRGGNPGEPGYRDGPPRCRAAADSRCIEADHGSSVQRPGEGVPALQRAGHPVDQQQRIAVALDPHGDSQPGDAGQVRVDDDRLF